MEPWGPGSPGRVRSMQVSAPPLPGGPVSGPRGEPRGCWVWGPPGLSLGCVAPGGVGVAAPAGVCGGRITWESCRGCPMLVPPVWALAPSWVGGGLGLCSRGVPGSVGSDPEYEVVSDPECPHAEVAVTSRSSLCGPLAPVGRPGLCRRRGAASLVTGEGSSGEQMRALLGFLFHGAGSWPQPGRGCNGAGPRDGSAAPAAGEGLPSTCLPCLLPAGLPRGPGSRGPLPAAPPRWGGQSEEGPEASSPGSRLVRVCECEHVCACM